MEAPTQDAWVFGYGSLMWRPGFPYLEARTAVLHGYHRALCVWSVHHRGTPERPGLVLGLDRGGSCKGKAFRVAPGDWQRAVNYLHERELVTRVYRPRWVEVRLVTGGRVPAYTFVVRRAHENYAGRPDPQTTAGVVRKAAGGSGPNLEYVANTVQHLDEMGLRDGPLHRILRLAESDEFS